MDLLDILSEDFFCQMNVWTDNLSMFYWFSFEMSVISNICCVDWLSCMVPSAGGGVDWGWLKHKKESFVMKRNTHTFEKIIKFLRNVKNLHFYLLLYMSFLFLFSYACHLTQFFRKPHLVKSLNHIEKIENFLIYSIHFSNQQLPNAPKTT